MLPVLAILRRSVLWRAVLLPAVVALLGSAILGLLWGLSPPPSGTAATFSIEDRDATTSHPLSTITWQPTAYVGVANGDLAPAVHPTDPLRALLGGPVPLRYTTNGGASWQSAVGLSGLDQGVPAWLPGGNGQSALQVSLSQSVPHANLTPGPTGSALNFARSTDSGAHWSAPITLTIPGLSENLPYLWADANPSSPYYGRMYLTLTMLDAARTGSFDTVGILFSTDQGTTWSAPVGLVDPTEFAQGTNYNAFASAAVQPDGGVVVAWHRGTCCQTVTNVPNKVMWSRSTDGGVTFPISGTIVTVPISQSLEYNSRSPGGYFRWTPAPNIAADPLDGTLYAVWLAYRQPNTPTTASIYLSRSTDNGASWSVPVVVDNNGPYIFQFVPWVQVSPDHVVHVTYQAATTVVDVFAHFYIQSTDRGATWSTPFSLSLQGHMNGAVQGDFQATSLGGYNGSQGTILTSWEDELGSGVRIGTFPLGGGSTPSPSPTLPAPPPSSTPTRTGTPVLPTYTATIVMPSSTEMPPTYTATAAFTNTPTATQRAATNTPLSPTAIPTNTNTSTPVPPSPMPSSTTCSIQFSDVPQGSTFYPYIRCLACRGIINGYPDGTFRPNNNVTRGQLSKIISNAAGFIDPQTAQMFEDVPVGSTFFDFIGRLASRGYIGGYPCGGPGEPCVPPSNLPYFRPNNNATRGQISKIDANAAGFNDAPSGQQFEDVGVGSTYYTYTYRLVSRSIMGGYPCGGVGEPCVPPNNLPYVRPNNNATRGQTSKIVANTFFPNCSSLRSSPAGK